MNNRPVIATSVGGVVDLSTVVKDGSYKICERGISVPAGDVDAFAAGLVELVSDAKLKSSWRLEDSSLCAQSIPRNDY
jgi:hypothetical protein